jgi:2-haloacid dehalogenase
MRWVTFDCFGTLIDWRHGIATSAELIAPGHGGKILQAYQGHEPLVQAESPTLRYRAVMDQALRRACAELGIPLQEDDASVLGATIAYWPPFSEVPQELAALRASGWNLALLTNCDRDIVGETQRRLAVRFDAVLTAEDVGAYKPAHDHFIAFQQTFGATSDRWVHVAQSYFHDIVPAHELGIPRVWVNRLGEADDASIADAVITDLRGLAAVLA